MKTQLIAEIGQAHEGSLGMAHAYISAAAKAKVHVVKFQTHIAAAESSVYEPFRVQFTTQDASRFDYWKRMEFTLSQWKELKLHCDDAGVEFMSSPFSNAAVDLLEEVGVERYKIGSGEVTNFLLLEKIAKTKKPVILSSGMSSLKELDAAVAFLKERAVNVSVLQCTTAYPTKPENYGLNMLTQLKERYQVPIGFSDHSASIATGIAAVALGAQLLEFHVVFDKKQFGPDVKSSLTFKEVSQLVKAITAIEKALDHPVNKADNTEFRALKNIFEKSLAVNKDLPAGHMITFDDLEAKKPFGYGISATDFRQVLGKVLRKDKKQWDFLTEEDV